jgi:acetolactate synthase small subunit
MTNNALQQAASMDALQTAVDAPHIKPTRPQKTTTIGLLVNDRPGVLVRIAQVFARRAYNIESLVVSPARIANTSRMTITCSGPEDVLLQIILQLNKLIDVIHAKNHSDDQAVMRELALFKVACSINERTEVLQIAEVFRAKTVDISDETITLESTGTSEKMDALERLLYKFDLREMIRTGKVVMARSNEIT